MARVLVIDDDTDLLTLHSDVLKNDGQDVYTAQSAEEGLKLWEEVAPDCVLLDLLMTDMDGLEALKEFNSRDPHLPVIIFTGYPSAENAIEALRRGAFDFLTKGCTLEEIVTTTRRAVETRFLQKENQNLMRQIREANANLERQVQQATAQLRAQYEFNQSLLEGIDSGFLAAADDERILFANRSALRMLDLHEDDITDKTLGDFGFQTELAQTTKRNATPHLGAETHTGELDNVEKQIRQSQRRSKYRTPDGRELTFGYSISKPESMGTTPGAGTGPGYIVLFRDVSEMEELRLHMQRLEKLETLNIIIAGVAHEIKNPVAGIKGVASLLLEIMDEGDEKREYVERILDETKRVIKQVENFFSFSRPSKPRRELTHVSECVDSVVRLMDDTAKQKSVALKMEEGEDIPQVYVDADQIKQIVLNLVTNAVQAIDSDGEVHVTVDKVSIACSTARSCASRCGIRGRDSRTTSVEESSTRSSPRRARAPGSGSTSVRTWCSSTAVAWKRATTRKAARSSVCSCRCRTKRLLNVRSGANEHALPAATERWTPSPANTSESRIPCVS